MVNVNEEIGPGITSLEYVRAQLRIDRPASIGTLLQRYREPIVIDEPLITPDGVALGGLHRLTLERNGRYRHEGHMRATGFPSFRFGVRTTLAGNGGAPVVVAASGDVHGTNEFGSRESSWDDAGDVGGAKLYWASLKNGSPDTQLDFNSDFFGAVGDVATFVGTLAGGALVAGPVGVCFALGVHAADAAGLDQELGTAGLLGIAIAAGVLVVFGPSAIVAAVVVGVAAGAVTELLLKHRKLTDRPAEVAFANRVFQGALPVDRIVLTNMLGIGNRPFTIPSVGDTILVNLGEGFDDPINYAGFGNPDNPNQQMPGQLFIHELTHTWQIDVASFLPGLMCQAVLNQSTTLGGDMSVYKYDRAGRDFGNFNLEQQASIVDDWFGSTGPQQSGQGSMSETSPYFRYIRDNIRRRLA